MPINHATTKLPGDQLHAVADWNAAHTITDMATIKEIHDGSDCTGGDGTTNRTLTCSKNLISLNIVVSGRSVLIENTDYTYFGAVITFLGPVFNSDKIMVIT